MRRTVKSLRRLLGVGLVAGCCVTMFAAVPTGRPTLDLSITSKDGAVVALDQFGTIYPTQVVSVTDQAVQGTTDRFTKTVVIGVRTPGSNPAIQLVAKTGGCDDDAAFGLTACLTENYTKLGPHAAVDSYVASWAIKDRQVALKRGLIRAAVLGRCLESSCRGTLDDNQEMVVDAPESGKLYSLVPRWRGKFVDIQAIGHHCANSELTWGRGTATNTFLHDPVCVGVPMTFG